MIQLKWLKSQLESYGTPDQCEIDWKTLDELFEQAKQMDELKGKTFQMTDAHLKLLSNLNVVWRTCEYGAPAIDCKRPYGNSDVESDIAEILGWDEPSTNSAERIHRELETALQIVLVTQKFEPGLYHLKNEYTTDWIKIG
jgi:hypothetical protein